MVPLSTGMVIVQNMYSDHSTGPTSSSTLFTWRAYEMVIHVQYTYTYFAVLA